MIARTLGRFEEHALSFLLVFMTLLVFVEVVLRFVFNTGFIWMQELTLHTSAWFVLFGASYGVKVGAHIGVDAAVRLLPPVGRRAVTLAAVVLCLIYCALFLAGGWTYIAKVYRVGITVEDLRVPGLIMAMIPDDFATKVLHIRVEDPRIPRWFAHGPLLVGFILLTIRFLQAGWMFATGQADTFRHADEVREALEQGRAIAAQSADEEATR